MKNLINLYVEVQFFCIITNISCLLGWQLQICSHKKSESHLNAIVMFSDQIQIFLILLGPKETSRGCVWDLFDCCRLRHFTDNLHFNSYLLELCEKVPYTISGQDQKDYKEACAINEACLELISTAELLLLLCGTKKL